MTTVKQSESQQEIKDAPVWLSFAVAIFLVLLGIGVGYYTFSQNQTSKVLDEKGVKVKGKVSFINRTDIKDIDKMNHYTINYSVNNKSYDYKTSLKYTYYIINEELVLLVNPDKPSQAMLMNEEDRNHGNYLWTLLFITVGILIIVYKRKDISKK